MKAKTQTATLKKKQQRDQSMVAQLLVAILFIGVGLFGLYMLGLSFQAWDNYQTGIPASQFCATVLSDKAEIATCIGSVFEHIESNRTHAQLFAVGSGFLIGTSLTGLAVLLANHRTEKARKN